MLNSGGGGICAISLCICSDDLPRFAFQSSRSERERARKKNKFKTCANTMANKSIISFRKMEGNNSNERSVEWCLNHFSQDRVELASLKYIFTFLLGELELKSSGNELPLRFDISSSSPLPPVLIKETARKPNQSNCTLSLFKQCDIV